MSQLEPYLSDEEVIPVLEKLRKRFPKFERYDTEIAVGRIEPPWHGQLPEGNVGWTQHPVLQFVISSRHPRPIQQRIGARHNNNAVVWQNAFEETRKERKHYVVGETVQDPLYTIFDGLAMLHNEQLGSLESIINDAVSDASKPKSALEAL